MKIIDRLMFWLIFTVVISLLPIGFHALQFINRAQSVQLYDVISNGELFIISVGMAATAIGEALSKRSGSSLVLFMVGICFILLIISAFLYADVAAMNMANNTSSLKQVLVTNSLLLYGFTFVCSTCCIGLVEIDNA